jgi:hypothetical protein
MFEAAKAFRETDIKNAKRLYEEGFKEWRIVIDKFPFILSDEETTGSDLLDFIKKYRRVLDQSEEKIGEDFPLWDVIEKFDRENDFPDEQREHRIRQGRALPEDTAPKKTDAPAGEPGAKPPVVPVPEPADAEAAAKAGDSKK